MQTEKSEALEDALAQLSEAKETLRAIGAGEVDAFLISDGASGHRVFTLATADRPYRTFVEQMRDGAATVTADGLVLYANPRLAELLRCPKESIVGRTLALRRVGESPESRFVFGSGARTSAELELVDTEGGSVTVLVGSTPLEVDGEHLTSLTFTDLTEERAKEAERIAADDAIRFQAQLLDTAGQAITAVDGRGSVIYWNKHAEAMYGWTAAEAVGESFADLVSPDETESAGGVVRRRDGTLFPVFATSTASHDDDGHLVATITVATDITERVALERIAEDSLRQLLAAEHAAELEATARAEANRANRAKSQFLTSMSHEMRTPLNAVLGFGQLLLLGELSPDQRENVTYIRRAGSHLLDLVNDVLDIARIEAGALRLSLEPVNLDDVIGSALGLIRPQAEQRRISLPARSGVSDDLFVRADRQRLLQVLLNLLSNAVKYNRPNGSIELACSVVGERVAIAITDRGLGISTVDMEKLFTPFERLGAEGSDVEGTGVGLALSGSLTEEMAGTLTAVSTAGEGSTFTIDLGVAQSSEASVPPEPIPASPAHSRSTRTLKVLAIDDDIMNVRLLQRILEKAGNVEFLSALQGRLGLEQAVLHQPDLILMDLHLSDEHGEKVLAELRENPATATIPVIVCSSDASLRQRRGSLDQGAMAHLTKPLLVTDLLDLVERVRWGDPPQP